MAEISQDIEFAFLMVSYPYFIVPRRSCLIILLHVVLPPVGPDGSHVMLHGATWLADDDSTGCLSDARWRTHPQECGQ